MKKVYCIGELLIDFVAEKQGKQLISAGIFTKKAGGAPANVACAISRLGGKSSFIGCVGNDPFGSFLVQILEKEGVDISGVQRSDTFTTLAFVSLAEEGERDFVFSRGADKELEYRAELQKAFHGNMIHLGAATALLGGALENTYARYMEEALEHNAFISFDPNFRADLWQNNEEVFIKKCLPYIEKATLCKFSREEATLISGKTSQEDACDFMHHLGTKVVLVTLGAEGTFVSTPDTTFTVPSIKVKAVDTTGAGDAFIGCLLYQISNLTDPRKMVGDTKELRVLVERANKAGAFTTMGFGAIESLPFQNDLDQLQ